MPGKLSEQRTILLEPPGTGDRPTIVPPSAGNGNGCFLLASIIGGLVGAALAIGVVVMGWVR